MIVAVLRRRFIVAPPSFGDLLERYAGIEHRTKFIALVRDYFPGEEEYFNKMKIDQAVETFVKRFSKDYFTIRINMDILIPIAQLPKQIPLEWHGMKDYEYDLMRSQTPARLLASVICQCPVERGSRIPVVEMFQERVGAVKVPDRGHSLQYVERALDGSPWPGLLYWCQWLFADTGNQWLDTTGESLGWDRETVDSLASAWKAYQLIDREMTDFEEWLGKDFVGRSIKILNYIEKRPKTLVEVFGEVK